MLFDAVAFCYTSGAGQRGVSSFFLGALMAGVLGGKRVVRFGEFEVNLHRRELYKQGQRVSLHKKLFKVLAILLEKPGDLVSRRHLRTRLWSAASYGNPDHILNVYMAKLRHVLADSSGNPRYIQTLIGRGYRFIAPVECAEGRPPKVRSGRIRLAVLPLALDASKSPGAPCDFCDGLAAEISADLAHRYPDQMGVIARSSVLKYRGTTKNPDQIGRELRANYLVEITCRTAGDSCRVRAQLVQAKDQTYLWAERYDYNSGNPLAIQQEVAERVAQSLGLKLLPGQSVETARRGRTQHPDAHLLYLKGCHQQWEQTEESLRKSIACFEQAVQLDPQYAMAYSALANSCSALGLLGFAGPPRQWFPKAREAARIAVEMNDTLAGPHVSLAVVQYLYEWDWTESEKQLRRALELNPSDSLAHRVLSYLLSSRRRPEEAIAEARQACELDPASLSASVCLGAAYYLGRRYEEAIAILQALVGVKPTLGPAWMWLGACYTMMSKHAEAIAALEKAREYRPHPLVEAWLASAYARAGRKKQATTVLAAELARLSAENYISAFGIALIHAALEQIDQAFEWLTKAREERCPFFAVLLPADPSLDSLRPDPRYATSANHFLAA
ncbi:MAG: hypothetical protein A3H27_18660 [Acidobacteria bacterium RIFCSPLOWO2_02_FULL_59_13]|nr:MAG: hypothetical protein A3H27_18660 [Acidobacteria bacterium RIFCSPLOWO2_02_FULL_59_13]